MQGNIGGETAEQAMTPAARDTCHKAWWAFAHDTMSFLFSLVPQAVGNAHRSRTQEAMDH